MEQLNIKDYLQINKPITEQIKKNKTEYNFSLIFDNGSDFIIERTTNNKIKRQLCFIASENLLFIRDPKTNNDKVCTNERQIKDFFITDDRMKDLEFKNKYFQKRFVSDFSYTILKLHNERINIKRNLIKYGLNPNDYLSSNRYSRDNLLNALDATNFDKVLKIIKIIQTFEPELRKKDIEYRQQITVEFILFLCRMQDLLSIDYVKIFLEIYINSDSVFFPDMNSYHSEEELVVWKCLDFERPLLEFNLDFKRYCTYLFRDLYSQGISCIEERILEEYYDCLSVQKQVYDKVKDKYPEHLKETHDKIVLIFNLNKAYFKEKKIEELNAHNKFLEFSDNNYSIIVAKTSQDLIEEGINLHHCVGSYVKRVQNGECSIFFLRKTDSIDTSLITIEVRQDKILQVRGLCERFMDDDERNFLAKWCKTKGLTFVSE